MPKSVVDLSMEKVLEADGVLVVGTSLQVYSIFRFIKAATEQKTPLAVVNIGPTRGDDLAEIKVEAQGGIFLPEVLEELKSRVALSLM